MTRTKSQQGSSFSESGRILGIRWYWWLVIILIVFFFSMGSAGIAKGAGGLLGQISRAFLGFADGVLNLLAKSPIFWFFAIAFLFPFLGRGASTIFTLYKSHFGSEKTTEDAAKDLGLDKDSLKDTIDQKRKEGKSEDQIRKEILTERGTYAAQKYVDLEYQRINKLETEGKISSSEASRQRKEVSDNMDKAVDDFNDKHDTEVEHPETPTPGV